MVQVHGSLRDRVGIGRVESCTKLSLIVFLDPAGSGHIELLQTLLL